jgi:hypothetical protein
VQNKTAEIPVQITKTIYNFDDGNGNGKFNPKTPTDFSAGPSSWNNRYACRRDFHFVGYSEKGSPIVVW